MNILPKKRWHVRTKANIERVRRDEAQAALEEKDRQRRMLFAEQEARTEELRRRNGYKSRASTATTIIEAEDKVEDQHVNLFDEGSAEIRVGPNKETQAEKKAEQEKWEKNVGILTYLGQSNTEINGTKPWYLQNHGERVHESSEKVNSRSEKRKMLADPLVDMQRLLKEKYGSQSSKVPERLRTPAKPSSSTTASCGKKSLEALRAERLRREKSERARVQQLLGSGTALKASCKETPVDDRQRQYNSQFNPHIARQNVSSLR